MFGWEFWQDSELVWDEDGYRTYAKNGYHCWCPPGVDPGDTGSVVGRAVAEEYVTDD